jgi:hypothetical protein
MTEEKSGGFHFGTVGRDVKIEAGGDIVAGDKISTTTTGFQQQSDKDEFVKQLGELRSALRDIKTQIADIERLDEDAKDELSLDILQQLSELKNAMAQAEGLDVGRAPPSEQFESVTGCLDRTGLVLDKIKSLGENASELAANVTPVLLRTLPLLASARHLIGLP